MSRTPTPAEVEAAWQRYKQASDAYHEASLALLELGKQMQAAGWEHLRLYALSVPLRDFLLDKLSRYVWRTPATVKRLAEVSYRDVAEVAACLDVLVAEGLVRRQGRGYESASGGAS